MKKSTLLLLMIPVLIAFISGSRPMLAAEPVQDDLPLEQLALQRDELPEGTKWIASDSIGDEDLRNPLHRTSPLRSGDFSDTYYVFAVSPVKAQDREGMAAAPVINFVYRYTTDAQAIAQWEQVAMVLKKDPPGVKVIHDRMQGAGHPMRVMAVQLTGSEGDIIYWFVGVKGNILTLLIVDDLQAFDGVARPSGRALFETLMARLLQR